MTWSWKQAMGAMASTEPGQLLQPELNPASLLQPPPCTSHRQHVQCSAAMLGFAVLGCTAQAGCSIAAGSGRQAAVRT